MLLLNQDLEQGIHTMANCLHFVSIISCMVRLSSLRILKGQRQIIRIIIQYQPVSIFLSTSILNNLRETGLEYILKKESWHINDLPLVMINDSPVGSTNRITLLLNELLIG